MALTLESSSQRRPRASQRHAAAAYWAQLGPAQDGHSPTCDRRRAEASGYLRERPIFMGLLRWDAHNGRPYHDGYRRLQPDGNLREVGGFVRKVCAGPCPPAPTEAMDGSLRVDWQWRVPEDTAPPARPSIAGVAGQVSEQVGRLLAALSGEMKRDARQSAPSLAGRSHFTVQLSQTRRSRRSSSR